MKLELPNGAYLTFASGGSEYFYMTLTGRQYVQDVPPISVQVELRQDEARAIADLLCLKAEGLTRASR